MNDMTSAVKKTKKLIIIGVGEFADIAYEYFTYDSDYEVVAFSVEEKYMNVKCEHHGLPIVPFENIEAYFSNKEHYVFVAVTYVKLNRARRRLFDIVKQKGYKCASYISSKAFVWHNAEIGENTFIFENNTIQYFVKIGNNVILWSGNHIGHRTVIEDDCWLTSHNVISGFCRIGRGSFLGVNATLGDNVVLGEDTVFGAAAVTVKSLPDKGCVYVGSPARKLNKTSYEQFGVEEE